MPYPRKRFGQHWLKDSSVHRAMVAAAGLNVEAMAGQAALPEAAPCVLEIGPGTGQLTRRLLAAGARVIGVELDRDLCDGLRRLLGDEDRFALLEGDILQLPLPAEPRFIVANIPYNITSPLLDRVLGSPEHPVGQFDRIVLLVQKELADRLSAEPNTKAYGAMTVRSRYLANCETLQSVPRTAFKPPPKVESAIIRLTPRSFPTVPADIHWFSILVRQGFATRRKTLANALQSLADKPAIYAALESIDRDPLSRAEALSVSDWIALSDALLSRRAVESTGERQPSDSSPSAIS
ncbi:16S rRNA (adenine(1518)-N(6)/adenine(1519)-N(6))-dimethyltransferase RsmA [Synechococcus sp. PCC 7336]|uniref:16S rRNA (adenine(1518)-N(6)/adenine(1519)-N(6))- dimethyltransferase RsmA n=1 Tax=Synechococcus sp. PCC 7336 TaxID=195250 RepID=UPI0003457E4D|nr:16S rRNA (adenine(1518)-N(6)/adenine(1519)-N(6))-dimethyltransferase RsmA [Synechococcus sp. PCC 7336]